MAENPRPPRLLYIVTSNVSARLMRGQMRYFRKEGYEVYFASSPGPDLEVAARTEEAKCVAVPMAREISPWKDMIALYRLVVAMRRIKPIITNVGTPKAGMLGGLAAYLCRVPCRVYTLRGLRWETMSGLDRWAVMFADWVSCHCAHRVVCVSPSLREAAVTAGIVSADRTVVLGDGSSNGVDSERFVPTSLKRAIELRQRLGIGMDAPVIGFVGRLTHDKGIAELYQAHRSLRQEFKDLRLLLLGNFEEGDPLSPELRSELSSDPSVICAGFVQDTSDYFHVFDVLAHPSHREGFPNVVLEAQAAGKPVVGVWATGTRDAILDGRTGFLVPAEDSAALISAIGRLLRDPSLRRQMGVAAGEGIKDRFSPQRVWAALAYEYSDLLKRKRLPLPEHYQFPDKVAAATEQVSRQ